MENASKALIMAGAILIGIVIITLGVYLYRSATDFKNTYEAKRSEEQILKFNLDYEKYLGQEKLTIHDVVTALNCANDYKKETGNIIQVKINGNSINGQDVNALIEGNLYKMIGGIKEIQLFTCNQILYNTQTQRVNAINFMKL